MCQAHVQRLCGLGERNDLFVHGSFDFRWRERQLGPPEVCPVGISGMRADRDAQFASRGQRLPHGLFIAGVAAARDVGGSNVAHQLEVSSLGERFLPLAQISVDVDADSRHLLLTLWKRWLQQTEPIPICQRPHCDYCDAPFSRFRSTATSALMPVRSAGSTSGAKYGE